MTNDIDIIDLKKRTFREMVEGSPMGKVYEELVKILTENEVPAKTANRLAAISVITALQKAKDDIDG